MGCPYWQYESELDATCFLTDQCSGDDCEDFGLCQANYDNDMKNGYQYRRERDSRKLPTF